MVLLLPLYFGAENDRCLLKAKQKMKQAEWILCPLCGSKTRVQIREDTELKNFPLYCPKCKQESLIEAKDLQVKVIKEPDA